ncbi:MAG: FAD-dependent thymidylate synthase [Syntrophales bacterium]|nr:FAD-dependent thymidylate synthase [Syntrophales bacterium]
MEIRLAGYNLDCDIIDACKKYFPDREDWTPETISAAYARISRSPKTVTELRADARAEVEKARRSNENIVFAMGHSSVAEHAVFNLDVLGVSRLLVEEIERFRLCSYTEKSQRYVLFRDDFVLPEEVRRAGLADAFTETIRAQYACYHALYEKLRPHAFARHPDLAAEPANRALLEGWAKEDARYIIALATETQLGMTVNARNLELMLRRLAAHPLLEAQACGREMYASTKAVAPSLIRYTEPTAYDTRTGTALREACAAWLAERGGPDGPAPADREAGVPPARLVHVTPEADDRIAAALVYGTSTLPLDACRRAVDAMTPAARADLFQAAFRHLASHDAVRREFEYADLTYELTMSASCFAQWKRHRMATITVQGYDTALGVTVPPAIREVGMEGAFRDVVARTEETYETIRRAAPEAAPYLLTNAHRRRVLTKINVRELYHIARLRADRHAQWDIRTLTEAMLDLAQKVMPLALMLAAGKDRFPERMSEAFGER